MAEQNLKRELSNRQVQMIALGGTIGTGLFLGAGKSIQMAGPSITLIYAITGIFLFWMMRALGEMLVDDDQQTTFIGFIEKYLGKRVGFIIGWSYWLSWIAVAMAEVTAIGKYMTFWFPNISAWAWELLFVAVLFLVNVITVKAFGEFEFWFALIKIVAILAMIATGIWLVVIHYHTPYGSVEINNLWEHGFFAHHGKYFLSAFQMTLFAFLGIEFVGITAAETKDPKQTIPKSVNSIIIRILVFYLGALAALMLILPWMNFSANKSPFVQVFSLIGFPAAAGLINFVVLTAAASALSSSLFTTGRMLYGLSSVEAQRNGHPFAKWLNSLNRQSIPMPAVFVSTLFIAASALINLAFPTKAFDYITSAAAAISVVTYAMVMLTHIKFRASDDYKKGPQLFKAPGSPITDYLTIAFMCFIYVIILIDPAMRTSALLALAWYAVITAISYWRMPRQQVKK